MNFEVQYVEDQFTNDTNNPLVPNSFELFAGGMGIFFLVVMLLVAGVFVAAIVLWVRNYRKAKEAGADIFTLQTDLAVKAANSQFLAPAQTKEQKLAELDGLKRKGMVTDEEYSAARMKILSE
ncbi:hypothetical protein AUR04nite_24020 [Glutamicibacter uratoxydans]|uniref:SHOCT domain-containing protein n=2 Tax=Glutamicibacter uratoxydans TaxID=43667 RepID=A0A4Y4DTS2_GLUUR|nr:hypothetical protein AUR04nite_24020 [Glutamicibacter uratoxydans]